MGSGIVAPLQYEGTMDSDLFELWFREYLLPALPAHSVIVMDNAAFHRKSRLLYLAQQTGYKLIFLPPYSPELNPIEHFWSWLKRQLRKTLPLHASFNNALFDCFQVR
jgi:transposase